MGWGDDTFGGGGGYGPDANGGYGSLDAAGLSGGSWSPSGPTSGPEGFSGFSVNGPSGTPDLGFNFATLDGATLDRILGTPAAPPARTPPSWLSDGLGGALAKVFGPMLGAPGPELQRQMMDPAELPQIERPVRGTLGQIGGAMGRFARGADLTSQQAGNLATKTISALAPGFGMLSGVVQGLQALGVPMEAAPPPGSPLWGEAGPAQAGAPYALGQAPNPGTQPGSGQELQNQLAYASTGVNTPAQAALATPLLSSLLRAHGYGNG